jgi:hypothetical protein
VDDDHGQHKGAAREKQPPRNLEVRPVPRVCSYRSRRGPVTCPLCAELVADQESTLYVHLRPLVDHNSWQTVSMADLAAVPKILC